MVMLGRYCQTILNSMPDTTERKKMRYIQKEFSEKWRHFLWNESLILECSYEETRYLTRPQDAGYIQTMIRKQAGTTPILSVLDAFACIGGDSIACMKVHRGADLHSVQRTDTEEERERFKRLVRNLNAVDRVLKSSRNPRTGELQCHDSDIKTVLEGPRFEISVLFLDPPWMLDSAISISSIDVIFQFIEDNVLSVLRSRRIYPPMICFKLPVAVDDLLSRVNLAARYQVEWCEHIRGKYFVYLLRIAS